MGEARRRGSYEDRVKQAAHREKVARAVRNMEAFTGLSDDQRKAWIEAAELQMQAKSITQSIGCIRVPAASSEEKP